jgi:hypothetical protein
MSKPLLRIKTAESISLPPKEAVLLSTTMQEVQKGTSFFGLVKILGKPDHKRKVLVQIIEEALTECIDQFDATQTVSRRFEQLLATVNDQIAEHIQSSANIPLSDFHAVLGVVHKEQLFLSGIGQPLALFLHRTAKQRYVIYELNKQFQTEDLTWNKPFTTVLDGELHEGDVFYLGTRIRERELTHGELQDILVTLPPSGALKRIQQFLHASTPYAGICIKIFKPGEEKKPKKLNPFSSIEELGQTKAQTAELLGEKSPDLTGWLQSASTFLLQKLSAPGSRGVKHALFFLLRFVIKILTQITTILFIALKEFFRLVYRALTGIFRLYKQHKTGERNLVEETGQKTERARKRLSSLPPATKYIAGGVLLTLLALTITLSVLNTRKERAESEQAFVLVQQRIEESIAEAEASLIYDNTDQARQAMNEALSLFETLHPANNRQEETYDTLQNEIDILLLSIRGISTPDLTSLAELPSKVQTIGESNGRLYAMDAQNALYKYDELTTSWDLLTLTQGSIGTIQQTTGSGSNLLFLDDQGNLGRLDLTNLTANPVVSGAGNLESTENLFIYNDALYILSAAAQQIVKMRAQGTGYEAGTGWITSLTSNLSQAVDLAIDGDVFVLTQNDLLRFNSGKELEFPLDPLDPPLQNATQIWTTVGTDYLYLLEPEQERLVVYTKSGDLVTQYVDTAFADAVGMMIREEENTIFLLTKEELLSFPAEHLLQ